MSKKIEKDFLDNLFATSCMYSELTAYNSVDDELKSKDSFISGLKKDEVVKYWNLVRHGILHATTTLLGEVLNNKGELDREKIEEIENIVKENIQNGKKAHSEP